MIKQLKVMMDYEASPLWLDGENIEIDYFGEVLSKETKHLLSYYKENWENLRASEYCGIGKYDISPTFLKQEDLLAEALAMAIQAELFENDQDTYAVCFFSEATRQTTLVRLSR